MRSRASRLERTLVFSLHAINIELESGIRFGHVLSHMAERDYGEFSLQMRQVVADTQKYGLKDALGQSARRNPSRIYRRALWQMINAIETGADMKANICSLIADLRRIQENEARRYGKSMEKNMAFYVMGGIVFPALMVVLLQAISSLGLSRSLGNEGTYWMIMAFSALVQLLFLFVLRFCRPAILGGSWDRSTSTSNPLNHMKRLFAFSGNKTPWQRYLINRIFLCVLCGLLLGLLAKPHVSIGYLPLIATTITLSAISLYTSLEYSADRRGMKADEYLPDCLRMIAANLEAGIAIDKALLMSAKEEFGVLSVEIRLIGLDMMKNLSFDEGLEKLKQRIKSESLHMSVNLISHGLRSGRGLSKSLFHISDVLSEREYLRRSIATQLHAVRAMVIILVVFCAPLLYACSAVAGSVMNGFNERMKTLMPPAISSQAWIRPTESSVSLDFLNRFVMTNLLVTTFLGSLIIGEVSSGRYRDGLRYMLMMAITSEIIYLLAKGFLIERFMEAFA
jgi:Flp pilus assembly protein TadB